MASLAEKRKADDEERSVDPQARPEELRLLEALLFASTEPLDQATLAKRMPDGVDIKVALAQLQADYASRGVNLVRIANKWTFRTAGDLSWLMTRESTERERVFWTRDCRLVSMFPRLRMIRLCAKMKTRWKREIWNLLWRPRSNRKPTKATIQETIKETRRKASKNGFQAVASA